MKPKFQLLKKEEMADDQNPYLALRQAKIARNQAKLRELGLEGKQRSSKATAAAAASDTPINAEEQSKKGKIVAPTRRSNRIRGQDTVTTRRSPWEAEQSPVVKSNDITRKRGRQAISTAPATSETVSSNAPKRSSTVPVNPNSVRLIELDIVKLVLGVPTKEHQSDDSTSLSQTQGFLGQIMSQTGKEFVIHQSFELASSLQVQQKLSFNKYCGVQPWASDAFFLWVNLGSPSSDVANDFQDGGRRITWFGGSRMHEGTPMMQDLIRVGKQQQQSDNSNNNKSGVVLWCRRYQLETKSFSPYMCLGRLAYHSHEEGSSPLAFVWDLIDRDRLAEHADPTIKTAFETIIAS